MEINEMADKLEELERRMDIADTERITLLTQNKTIVDNTSELLVTFNALKGAWVVLNFIGKLAKPLTFIASGFGLYFAIKGGTK